MVLGVGHVTIAWRSASSVLASTTAMRQRCVETLHSRILVGTPSSAPIETGSERVTGPVAHRNTSRALRTVVFATMPVPREEQYVAVGPVNVRWLHQISAQERALIGRHQTLTVDRVAQYVTWEPERNAHPVCVWSALLVAYSAEECAGLM